MHIALSVIILLVGSIFDVCVYLGFSLVITTLTHTNIINSILRISNPHKLVKDFVSFFASLYFTYIAVVIANDFKIGLTSNLKYNGPVPQIALNNGDSIAKGTQFNEQALIAVENVESTLGMSALWFAVFFFLASRLVSLVLYSKELKLR